MHVSSRSRHKEGELGAFLSLFPSRILQRQMSLDCLTASFLLPSAPGAFQEGWKDGTGAQPSVTHPKPALK